MSPLEQEITELWGHITAATHRFLELLAELDDQQSYGVGIVSCAHWLNLHCGIGIVAAREKVRIAHAIQRLPKINAAFRDGQISYSKVRAMTRVATPENEGILLNIALYGTASHVERTARYFRRVEAAEAARQAAEAHKARFVRILHDDDGQCLIQGRVPAEVGELFRTALERAVEIGELEAQPYRRPADDSAESSRHDVASAVPEDHYPQSARRADALRLIAERFLETEAENTGSAPDRFQVVVHIDHTLLSHRSASDSETGRRGTLSHRRPMVAEFEDGPTLAAETARRLACDGSLVGIIDGRQGEPLDVGRKTRSISAALRRALKARDGGCRFPGCTHTRFTEAHHVVHWAHGGETKLANLITLCHFHHQLLHEGGFGLKCTDDGLFVFTAPSGERLPEYIRVERRFRGSALAQINRERDVDIGPRTILTRWGGERMDYSAAIEALLGARERARAQSLEREHREECAHIGTCADGTCADGTCADESETELEREYEPQYVPEYEQDYEGRRVSPPSTQSPVPAPTLTGWPPGWSRTT